MVIPIVFLAHHIGEAFLFSKHPDASLFEKFREHLVLKFFGLGQQITHILKHIQPFVLHGHQFILCFFELRHLNIIKGEFFIHLMMVFGVFKHHFVDITIVSILFIGKHEVEDSHDAHFRKVVIPFPFRCLLHNGRRCVIHRAILEVRLVGALHLHDKMSAVFGDAINIEHRVTVTVIRPQDFRV